MTKAAKGKAFILLAIGLVALSIFCIFFHGLSWKSEQEIHDWALTKAPIGSSVQEVQAFIQSQGWEQNYNWQGKPDQLSETYYPGVKGEHIIGANLGHYPSFIFTCDIDAYWGFNASGKLVEVRVRKMYDGL